MATNVKKFKYSIWFKLICFLLSLVFFVGAIGTSLYLYEIYSYTDNGFELLASVEFASGAINSRGIYIGDTAYIFCGNEIAAVDLKTGETISMQTL